MTASTATAPVKGMVFKHSRRIEYNGEPRQYTITSVQQGKVHYIDSLRMKQRCKIESFPSICGEVVSVPEPGAGAAQTGPRMSASQCRALHYKAHAEGLAAGEVITPEPMLVQRHANPLDDSSPVVQRFPPVMSGVCGFAYVNIRPGGSSFARWMRKNTSAYTGYYGGTQLSVHSFGQSMERKMAYASAYAEVLREAGINATTESRMD